MNFIPDYVFVIGTGGTGGHIAPNLARMIAYHQNTSNTKVVFIDGDSFEESNMYRQLVGPSQVGLNKARAMVDLCAYLGLSDNIECKEEFLNAQLFTPMIRRAMAPLIVCAVDNDATRKEVIEVIEMNCKDDFFFVTPGNSDGTETVKGQTLWYGRINGQNYGLNPAEMYDNIGNPQDSVPHKGSCSLHAPSRPQLISANFLAAAQTLTVVQNLLDGLLDPKTSNWFFNGRTMKTAAG